MFRITSSAVMRGYRSSLTRATSNLNKAMDTVLSGRNFNSFADDPAAATKSFRLHSQYNRIVSQQGAAEEAINKFQTASEGMSSVKKTLDDAKKSILEAISDTSGQGRNTLGTTLIQNAEAMTQALNGQYGDTFIFAGADGNNVPFELVDGKLTYRGLDVSSTDPAVQAKLQAMAGETTYLDLGMGMKLDANGRVIPSSAFNSSIPGNKVTGYGVDADGDSQNIVELVHELGVLFKNAPQDGAMSDAELKRANELEKKLSKAIDNFSQERIAYDAKSTALQNTGSQLKDTSDTLNEHILSVEKCDTALALSAFAWAQSTYNAALKAGNSILEQSFIDFMR